MFYPSYSTFEKENGIMAPLAWRIATSEAPLEHLWGYENQSLGDLGFATKKDCESAIASLIKHGYVTEESIETLADYQFAQICLQNLNW